jgi:hypothetical protein
MKQPLISSQDEEERTSIANGHYKHTAPQHSLTNGRPHKRYVAGYIDEDAFRYIKDKKRKTVVDRDDEDYDVESNRSRRLSDYTLKENPTLCEYLRHKWRRLSDVRGRILTLSQRRMNLEIEFVWPKNTPLEVRELVGMFYD